MEKLLEADFDESRAGGRIQQRGAGAYTLCGRCNNFTGRAYARHFAAWCHQGMEIMVQASGRPTLVYMDYVSAVRAEADLHDVLLCEPASIQGEARGTRILRPEPGVSGTTRPVSALCVLHGAGKASLHRGGGGG